MSIDYKNFKDIISKIKEDSTKQSKLEILKSIDEFIEQQALTRIKESMVIEEENLEEYEIKIEEQSKLQKLQIETEEQIQNCQNADHELFSEVNQFDSYRSQKSHKPQQNENSIIDINEDDLFSKEKIDKDINKLITLGKIKILPKNINTSAQKRQNRKAMLKKKSKRAQKEKKIDKTKSKIAKKNTQDKKPIRQTKKKEQLFDNKSFENQNQNIVLRNIDTQTDIHYNNLQQLELSEINFNNIGLSKLEKQKIEWLSIQLRSQIDDLDLQFQSAAQASQKSDEDFQLIGFAQINGKQQPFVQQSPFFIEKEKLSLKNQILFEQCLKENGCLEKKLTKSSILLSQEDAIFIQKILHKIQQQLRRQKK